MFVDTENGIIMNNHIPTNNQFMNFNAYPQFGNY